MFHNWRFKLKEAEEALKLGRLEEANKLLSDGELQNCLPGQRLTAKIAQHVAQRACRRVASGEPTAAWRDLQLAQKLGGETDDFISARDVVLDQLLSDAEARLKAGDPASAISRIERLEHDNIVGRPLALLKDVARKMESARNLARRGRFGEADEQLASAATLRPDLKFITQKRAQCREKMEQCRKLAQQLHHSMGKMDWTAVLNVADQMLEMAPEWRDAINARRRAWNEVNARRAKPSPLPAAEQALLSPPSPVNLSKKPDPKHTPQEFKEDSPATVELASEETDLFLSLLAPNDPDPWITGSPVAPVIGKAPSEPETTYPDDQDAADQTQSNSAGRSRERLMLWVDGVGGYLLCLHDDVVIGQATPENAVDIPILGELSRRHARIRREGEEYFFEPFHPVKVNGSPVQSPKLLADGDALELGGVRLRFRKPHALSATARLEFLGRHRSQPRSDGVLMMAESCVMGPAPHNHVVCHDWPDDVVLYRQQTGLFCRAMEDIEIDGKLCEGRGPLNHDSSVKGLEFSFGLESLD